MSLLQSLLKPTAYPHPVQQIELIETHISWVILTGDYAYKIKKPVQFDFLDFSTLEKRRFFCQEELRLNQRLAPALYLDVVTIAGSVENPLLNSEGEVIEYAVKMRQFSPQQVLSEVAKQDSLSAEMMDELAALIADFHRRIRPDFAKIANDHGSVETIQHWFAGNFTHIFPLLSDEMLLQKATRLEQWGKQKLQQLAPLMTERKQQGFIRECHGDLHLGNIALFENQLIPFDGIEFNPQLRWIDVMSEIAFLIMDLAHYGKFNLAYRFLNRYLTQTGDYQGLALLNYYLVYRALVRTKIALLRWQQSQNSADWQEAVNYLHLAESFSSEKSPLILITHGYSGSGKSTVAKQLAEKYGMIHLRSDIERQRLFQAQESSGLNQGLYTADKVQRTYQHLLELTANMTAAGFSVIVDATFLQQAQRELFQHLAAKKKRRLLILDFQVPKQELMLRIEQRLQLGKDASQATLEVLQQQIATAQPLTDNEQKTAILISSYQTEQLDCLMSQKLGK